MKLSVFGLGYVGAVTAGCLADRGHTVVGVDSNPDKVDLIARGMSPIIEERIGDMIADAVASKYLTATTDANSAVTQSELSIICVGTPSQPNGDLDLTSIRGVCRDIGNALAAKEDFHIVVLRSTMLPGSMRDTVIPMLEEASTKKAGVDFGICFNPEFLREGTAVYDFNNPPKTVIGEIDKKSGSALVALYSDLQAPLIRTSIEVAEMVKYVDNVWHALKVCFANEIGNICKSQEIDSHQVMEIFCQDTKLNLSPYYLKPGFAFGGSCLPKDVLALSYRARTNDLDVPVLNAIMPSNRLQIDHAFSLIERAGSKQVGILGLSFKAGTDDLRSSPQVELVERLIGKGYDVQIFDSNVQLARLVGANREYLLKHIPHISELLIDSMDKVVRESSTIVIANNASEFSGVVDAVRSDQKVVDLVRIQEKNIGAENYYGLCW